MTNVPAKAKNECAPSSVARADHREWIGGRALTLLGHYWRNDDPVEMTAAIGADWADVLEGIPQQFIQMACIRYQRDEPRRKPTPGAVYSIAKGLIPKPVFVRKREPERTEPRVTASAATEIMRAAGFGPKKFGGKS